MNNNLKYSLIAIIILSVLIGILIGYGLSYIQENKCVKNPLYYGISQLEQGNLKIKCSCYFNNINYYPFFFNKTGLFPYGN